MVQLLHWQQLLQLQQLTGAASAVSVPGRWHPHNSDGKIHVSCRRDTTVDGRSSLGVVLLLVEQLVGEILASAADRTAVRHRTAASLRRRHRVLQTKTWYKTIIMVLTFTLQAFLDLAKKSISWLASYLKLEILTGDYIKPIKQMTNTVRMLWINASFHYLCWTKTWYKTIIINYHKYPAKQNQLISSWRHWQVITLRAANEMTSKLWLMFSFNL